MCVQCPGWGVGRDKAPLMETKDTRIKHGLWPLRRTVLSEGTSVAPGLPVYPRDLGPCGTRGSCPYPGGELQRVPELASGKPSLPWCSPCPSPHKEAPALPTTR